MQYLRDNIKHILESVAIDSRECVNLVSRKDIKAKVPDITYA